ncbi:disintegrin and metalloproteinase domain-containing protein 20-like [Phyllostomus hastatus]|uniref:disintegrin and metalloproteinase domain-containing protein 20-like n=1 Tax=Phyllostomus hastatus TaxID=9423 RepID=UPI001E680F43|nr:disintegrin and metalloproteinase domain-containing protein 20-like [Phyllostomus hastatus]
MAVYGGSIMAMDEDLVHVRNTVLSLWLGVFLFLYQWSQVGHSQRHGPLGVVIPLKVTVISLGMKPGCWLSYSMHFGGQKHIVHMKVNNYLLSRHLQVFSYTNQGALLLEQPFIQNDCYYQGYVEGDPESMVTLCTCLGGFQRTLQTNDVVYEIEPKRHSTTFEHLIYKVDRKETQFPPMRCGLTDEETARQLKFQETVNFTLMQSGYEGWWTHKRFLELAVVVDYNRYMHRASNTTKVQYEVFLVVNGIDNFLSSLDVDVVLMGIEVSNARNLLPVNNISDLLVGFCRWKKNSFNNCLTHDVAHVFVKQHYVISVGLAYVEGVCNFHFNCGVDSFMNDDVHDFAYIVSHELGHNLGIKHDENTLNVGNIFTVTQCGNSVVEGGKECDCGTLQFYIKDPCCQLSCTLRLGAACAFGLCCQDCQILPTGTVCRQQENTCDLPEWCNGTSNHCPEDVYVQDGIPCEDSGYCYEKRCNNREEQCRNIFGKEAKSANQSCYTKMNTHGERFGNWYPWLQIRAV